MSTQEQIQQEIDNRLQSISDNEEKIRQFEKDNHWHKKYIRLLKQQQEEEKESEKPAE